MVVYKLKAEDELLLRCARSKLEEEDEDRIISLLDNNLDWDYLINKAARNRLRPLLYLNLNQVGPERVPEDVLQGLKEFFKNNARRNLMLTGELVKVMALLEDNGIKAVTYKGPVLAKGAYGNLAYREFGDVDVLIDEKNALKVLEVMKNEEYELISSLNIKDSFYMKFVTEHQFISKKGVLFEIKWKFAGDFFTFPVDSRRITEDFEKISLGGFDVNTFTPDNQVLILSIHAGKHDWNRFSWIVDIHEFIKTHNINWQNCLTNAEALGVKKIFLITLYLTQSIGNLDLPENIQKEIDSNLAVAKLGSKVQKRLLMDEDSNIFGKLFSNLQKRDKIIYGIKDSVNGLLKPGYHDYSDIPLPESFFRLYHILRPFLLWRRYGKDPI